MHRNDSTHAEQQKRRVRRAAATTDSYAFFDLLTGPELRDHIEAQLPEHRERLFPPTETLSMFLAQALNADRSCRNVVNDAAVKRLLSGRSPCSTHTGAYCTARKRLPHGLVASLLRRTGEMGSAHMPSAWRWHGRAVRLVDGTTLSMPDTDANQAAYPQLRSQKPGVGFPLCRMVGIVCLGSGVILDAAVGPFKGKGGDEQTLLRSLLASLKHDDVLVGDAFFATYFLLCELIGRGIDGVFVQHGSRRRVTDFRRGPRLGVRDHLIELRKPLAKPDWMSVAQYEQAPEKLTVRELSTGGKVLVTTLLCAEQTPKHVLKSLYRNRWHIELDFRSIKTVLGMEVLSCLSPEMVRKEIHVYLLAYNLIRLIMAQSAILADRMPRELSFKHTLQLWIAWMQHDAGNRTTPYRLFELIAEQRVGNRPGRIEPRAIKRRPKPYPLLTTTRQKARATIVKHGHPKKVK
jgi:Transposase DDE domain